MSDADDPSEDHSVEQAVEQAADTLYAAPPANFLATRTSLAAAAKADGATDAARRIGALRKPTAAASLVNRLALTDASVLERIVDLGDRLREAHDALDPTAIRELTTERRTLVAGLTRTAAKGASTAVRDEVSSTFDAAVADPSVAERLGRLMKAERWSGFGLAPAGPPSLTVVRGGRSTARPTTKAAAKAPAARRASAGATAAPEKREAPTAPTAPPAAKARLTRALTRAQEAFDTAEADLTAADGAERSAGEQVRTLTAELAELQRGLEAAKQELDAARRAARAARTRRREARSALDRAERNKERG